MFCRSRGIPSLPALVAVMVFGSGGLGCAVKLHHDPLDPPVSPRSGPLHYEERADGLEGKVGWGRGTFFGIPFVPIYIQGDRSYGSEKLMEQVRDALVAAGYEPISRTGDEASEPVLHCRVERIGFNNYTWLFPIVPTWGSIAMRVELRDAQGGSLWRRDLHGDGFTLNFFNGYTSAARQSLNEILQELVEALASDEFAVALSSVSAAGRTAEAGAALPSVSAEPPAEAGAPPDPPGGASAEEAPDEGDRQ